MMVLVTRADNTSNQNTSDNTGNIIEMNRHKCRLVSKPNCCHTLRPGNYCFYAHFFKWMSSWCRADEGLRV